MKFLKPKGIICTFFAALIFVYTLKTEAQNVEVGIRYNPEFTSLLNRNDMNAGSELMPTSNFVYSGSFGAGVIFNFSRNYGLALDILFSREGQRFKGYLASSPSDAAAYSSVVRLQAFQNNIVIVGDYVAKAELNYIKIPLTMSFSSDNSKPFFFTMLVGPQLNILQGVAQEVNHEDLEYPNSNITPYDFYKPITFDGVLALGGAYNLSKHMVLSARFRLDYGFEDVENKNAMVSYSGGAPVRFYSSERGATHNITEGLMLGVDYKL